MRYAVPGLGTVVVGGLTAANLADPGVLTVHGGSSSGVIETVATLGASLVSYLAFGRWQQSHDLRDLLVCYAFGVLAASNLGFAVVPLVIESLRTQPGIHAAAAIAGLTSAVLLLGAAIAEPRDARPSNRPTLDAAVFILGIVIVAVTIGRVGALLGNRLGLTGEVPSPEAMGDPAHVAVTVFQLVTAAAFLGAALRFVRRPLGGGLFSRCLTVGAALWAAARLNYAFTPESAMPGVTVGDWLRLAAYAVLVVGAAAEIRSFWRGAAEKAVLEERRRIARELHDGLAQELAFIAGQSVVLARQDPSSRRAVMLRGAAERALDESRRAIAALTRPLDEPLDVALALTAEELASRLGARVTLDLDPDVAVSNDAKEALLRIAREAMTNAVRHGAASRIRVSLADGNGVELSVADDGCGFDPAALPAASHHIGLVSMRERAEALGGTFSLASSPGSGTRVTVHLP